MAAPAAPLLLVLISIALWLVIRMMISPVSRARVERFANRQQLLITPENGNQVIRYLAVTRRWRTAGVVIALALGLAWLWIRPGAEVEVDLLQLLSGWFGGAVAAEALLSRAPAEQRRQASLASRDWRMYLPAATRAAVPVAVVINVLLTVAAVVLAIAGRGPRLLHVAVPFVAALGVAAIVWLVGRHVLTRPQPMMRPDELAADDAIRSRSLHALAGSGTALVLYAANWQLAIVQPALPATVADAVGVIIILLAIAAPLIGWRIATLAWTVRRGAQPNDSVGAVR